MTKKSNFGENILTRKGEGLKPHTLLENFCTINVAQTIENHIAVFMDPWKPEGDQVPERSPD